MFDFRYHALSLVAVFISLVVGLLLGVAVGDKELVSSAREELRSDLQGDVREARQEAAELRAELQRRQRYEEQTYGPLVADRLDGRRVLLLFLDERSEQLFSHVRDALRPSGAELAFVSTLEHPLDLAAIAELAAGTRYERLDADPTLLDDLGRRVGLQLVQGGRLVRDLQGELLTASSGELEPVESVVVARTGGAGGAETERRELEESFVEGLLDGLNELGTPVVGVEESTTKPSQIGWYREHDLASVDNVDDFSGRASLVWALSGAATGAYGEKPTADGFLPETLLRSQ